MKLLFLFCALILNLYALPFALIKHESLNHNDGPTLLVISGIHGNEPGSYFAASILAEYYTIQRGNLWIVPNLNHTSITMNSRGINGDMNRKFAEIDPNDPDYTIIQEIKTIINEPKVDLLLNLHDGHGFYRKEYKNTIFNPGAWGQTCVIDQNTLDSDHPYKDLNKIALAVREELNDGLIEDHHCFDIRNTNTRFDDEAMKHSLTYYAINHNKPAFAIETSKNLPTLHEKVFYQLRAIEAYMRFMGIAYKRSFDLNTENLIKILNMYESVTINNTSVLYLENVKKELSFIPLKSDSNLFEFTHPLGFALKNKDKYDIFIGNKKVTTLLPSVHDYIKCDDKIAVEIDKNQKNITFATEFFVIADFKVIIQNKDLRVNIIGYSPKKGNDEANVSVSLGDLDPKYSIDKDHKVYRIEFYRGNRFCGMVLAHFN